MRERYQRPGFRTLGRSGNCFTGITPTVVHVGDEQKLGRRARVPSQREAQREADQLMEKVNARNNEPHLFTGNDDTVQAVYNKCRELTWPHLKNSTRNQYEDNFKRLTCCRRSAAESSAS